MIQLMEGRPQPTTWVMGGSCMVRDLMRFTMRMKQRRAQESTHELFEPGASQSQDDHVERRHGEHEPPSRRGKRAEDDEEA